MEDDFFTNDDHFTKLVGELSKSDASLYKTLRYTRTETGFKGRHFIVYQMSQGAPIEIDRLIILDYWVDTELGTACRIQSKNQSRSFCVEYRPVQLFDYPIIAYLPLYAKLRWAASERSYPEGSLGFPIVIKTKTDNTNVRGVVYCSTGPDFARQFDPSFES